jgi:hypothetical protein
MTENYPTGGLGIKQRIKEFQRQHLLAAGEALYAVLAELKVKGEVSVVIQVLCPWYRNDF